MWCDFIGSQWVWRQFWGYKSHPPKGRLICLSNNPFKSTIEKEKMNKQIMLRLVFPSVVVYALKKNKEENPIIHQRNKNTLWIAFSKLSAVSSICHILILDKKINVRDEIIFLAISFQVEMVIRNVIHFHSKISEFTTF